MRGRSALALSVAAGLSLGFSAPPFNLWPLALLAPVFLAAALQGASTRRALWIGQLTGTIAWLVAGYWIVKTVTFYAGVSLPLALLLYALFGVGQGVMLAAIMGSAAAATPSVGRLWALTLATIAGERFVSITFPWQFADTLIDAPLLPQSAELITVSGVSALMHVGSDVLVRLARDRGEMRTPAWRKRAGIFAASIVLVLAYGAVRKSMVSRAMAAAPVARVALLQPAFEAQMRWDATNSAALLQTLQYRTNEAMRLDPPPAVVVWHEGAYPFLLPHRPQQEGQFNPPVYGPEARAPIVFGLMSGGEGEIRYNAAMMREIDGSISQVVAKRSLVPFGEEVPLSNTLPAVSRIFWRAGGLTPGSGSPLMRTRAGLTLGILICFEDTLSHIAAQSRSADVLVNITNDVWFGNGPALEEHLLNARWRSIELRRETVRAVNTGVTAHIDALGAVHARVPVERPAILLAQPRRLSIWTPAPFVALYGGPIALVALLGAIAVARVRRRKEKTQGDDKKTS